MSRTFTSFLALFALASFFCPRAHAQGPAIQQQIEIRHDNDFILLTDRYYSSGMFLTYRKALAKGISKNNEEQLSFTLGQEIYTPSQTQSTNSAIFDRPYAGFLGLRSNWSVAAENRFFEIDILLGVAGLNSGAGGFQRWFHNIVSIKNSPLWVDEINNSIHVNLYAGYAKEWQLVTGPFGVRFAAKPNIAIGTKDIYVEPEGVFYFGKRSNTDESIAYNRLGAVGKEMYFALRASARGVFYNGLIEGNLLGDDSPVLRDSSNLFLRLGFDFYHRSKKNDYKVGLRYNTGETARERSHSYMILSYALGF